MELYGPSFDTFAHSISGHSDRGGGLRNSAHIRARCGQLHSSAEKGSRCALCIVSRVSSYGFIMPAATPLQASWGTHYNASNELFQGDLLFAFSYAVTVLGKILML